MRYGKEQSHERALAKFLCLLSLKAARGILEHMTAKTANSQLTYLAELNSPSRKTKLHKMDHLACFAGGMFALGAAEKAHGGKSIQKIWYAIDL